MFDWCEIMLFEFKKYILNFVIGGMVVGIGINVYFEFGDKVVYYILENMGYLFVFFENKFYVLIVYDEVVYLYGILKVLVGDLMKIVNDVRWLVLGLWVGLVEIFIFENELGLLIMFGKVNFI